MFQRLLLFFGVLLFSLSVSAQKRPVDLRDYQYKHEASGGLRLQTNGFTIYGEYGWIKDIFRTRLIQLEYTYYVDYRQKKQHAQTQGGRDYLFGFQNKFHTLRFSYGIKRTIADKASRNGVRLSFIAFGGVSLGLLKPYYLNLLQPVDGAPVVKPERYSLTNESRFLDRDSIVEAAPIRYGLNQMQPVPGVHGKAALNFDWGTKDEFVKE